VKKALTQILKKFALWLLGLLLLIILSAIIYMSFAPQFGGSPSEQQKDRYQKSENYIKDKFQNAVETNMNMKFSDLRSLLGEYIKGNPDSKPDKPLPVIKHNNITAEKDIQIMWFGHSAFWIGNDDLNILIDPMFSDHPAPNPLIGTKRFSDGLPIEIENLPRIDAIFFSHDHYDHLDYESVLELKDKTDHFFVPLGLAPHLIKWGVSEDIITELDWWEESSYKGIDIACTPSRHLSGRSLLNRFSTLWCSWVIEIDGQKIYFSGDSGYTPQFKEIGDKYGPIDFAMMECGQYNYRWSDIHMMPEETAQAAADVQAKIFMPIHWGSFKLSLHDWDDPVKRVTAKANELTLPIITPQIGEIFGIPDSTAAIDYWWKAL
jgi:L-ascorbate metabolism protein UlaG (beta-lactamase superfamily)